MKSGNSFRQLLNKFGDFMRLQLSALTAAVALFALPTSVSAEGGQAHPAPAPVVIAEPAPVTDWSGAYAGLSYGRVEAVTINPAIANSETEFTDGNVMGLFAGYNLQNGRVVYGGEIAYHQIDGVESVISGPATNFDTLLDVRARAGMTYGTALFYGAVGYSHAHYNTLVLAVPPEAEADFTGFSLGLGAELQLTERVVLGVDYTMRELSGTIEPGNFDREAELDTLTLRASFRF